MSSLFHTLWPSCTHHNTRYITEDTHAHITTKGNTEDIHVHITTQGILQKTYMYTSQHRVYYRRHTCALKRPCRVHDTTHIYHMCQCLCRVIRISRIVPFLYEHACIVNSPHHTPIAKSIHNTDIANKASLRDFINIHDTEIANNASSRDSTNDNFWLSLICVYVDNGIKIKSGKPGWDERTASLADTGMAWGRRTSA